MKKQFIGLLTAALVLANTMACSTQRAYVKTGGMQEDVLLKAGSIQGEELGAVSGEEGRAIWNNCTEKATGSVRELIANAKAKGANAIGDIK